MTRITAPSPTPSTSPTEQSDASYVPSERRDTDTTSSSFEGPYDAHLSNRWTRQEEEVLFDCVARHPRGGWPLIADDFDAKMSMGGGHHHRHRTIGAMQHKYQSMRREMIRRALAAQRMERMRKEEEKAEAEAKGKEEPWHKRLGKAMVAFNNRSSVAGPAASTAASPERMNEDEPAAASAAGGQQGTHGQNGSKKAALGSMALSKWQAGVQGEQRGGAATAGGRAPHEVSRSGEV